MLDFNSQLLQDVGRFDVAHYAQMPGEMALKGIQLLLQLLVATKRNMWVMKRQRVGGDTHRELLVVQETKRRERWRMGLSPLALCVPCAQTAKKLVNLCSDQPIFRAPSGRLHSWLALLQRGVTSAWSQGCSFILPKTKALG